MEEILSTLQALDFDWKQFGLTVLVLAVGSLLLSFVGKHVFGERSNLHHSISSAFEILFVYAATIVLYTAGAQFQSFIAPLPFIDISGSNLSIFCFRGAHYTNICSQVLSMVILAFFANLIDTIMPKGKKFFSWLILRVLTVALAMIAHVIITQVLSTYAPEGLMTYAPVILLGLLVVMLLVGALKLIVGALLSTVHPLIGAFYTFFFATVVGKALTKAVLTTILLSALVIALNYIGITVISIASAALIAYIPLLIILLLVWYLVTRII